MPVLAQEPDRFPDDLFDRDLPAQWPDGRWWAFYTMSRREKELMRRLRAQQIPFYGPLAARRSRTSAGRVQTSYVPLFPGYVFAYAGDDQRVAALKSNCVSKCLEVHDEEELLHDLRQVAALVDSGVELTPEAQIQEGMRVRIRGGSLMGMEGTVIKRRGGDRLLVMVRFLQQGVSMELADFQLERIEGLC